MAVEVEITREDAPQGGRYVAKAPGGEGELSYRRTASGNLLANHTGVPHALRGQGIAEKLVERLVLDARAGGYKVVPVCSYVVAQRKRHPEWADAFADG